LLRVAKQQVFERYEWLRISFVQAALPLRRNQPAAMGGLLALVIACWPGSARAQSLHCSSDRTVCDLMIPVVAIAGGGAATLLAINGYETVADIDDAWRGRWSRLGRARFETAWGGWQAGTGLVAISLLTATTDLAQDFDDAGEPLFGMALATSWPLGMTTHGAWAANGTPPDSHAVGWLVPLALVDAGPLGFDAWQTAHGARPGRLYSSIEVGVSALQLAYGAGGLALGASALPAMLFVHGMYALILGERKAPARNHHGASWHLLPAVHSETGVGAGFSVYGQF
jgi:hypothetical protein